MKLNARRSRRLAENAIGKFALDLRGLVVLTEAATNHYSLTPLIAALAGADRVIALGRDSRFGSFAEVRDELLKLASAWGVKDRLLITDNRSDAAIAQADIVTNLGFVRPLDDVFLARLKSTVSVPLMWETWEFRKQDMDIEACRRLGIPVLGTNEDHPELRTIQYLGPVAIKLLFELDIEVLRSRLVIVGGGKFATAIRAALLDAGAEAVDLVTPGDGMSQLDCWNSADTVIFAEHSAPDLLLGPGGWLEPAWLAKINPAISVAHICGNVNETSLNSAGLRYTPSPLAGPGYMSVTTDYVGPRPLIDLHAAGLRIGELLARTRVRGIPAFEAETQVMRACALAQGFEGVHETIPPGHFDNGGAS